MPTKKGKRYFVKYVSVSFLIYFENQINTLLSFITAHPSNRGFVLNSGLTNVRLSGWDKDTTLSLSRLVHQPTGQIIYQSGF